MILDWPKTMGFTVFFGKMAIRHRHSAPLNLQESVQGDAARLEAAICVAEIPQFTVTPKRRR